MELRDDDVQHAHEEIEALCDEVQVLFDTIAAMMSKVDETSGNLFRTAGQLGKAAVSPSIQGSQYGAVLGEAGLVLVGVGLAVKAAGAAWGELKKRWVLSEILTKKQEIARSKQSILRSILPRIDGHVSRIEKILDRSALALVDPTTINRFKPLWDGFKPVVSNYYRCRVTQERSRWALQEFEAWLAGKQSSGAFRPDAGLLLDDAYLRLVRGVEGKDGGSGLATSIALGAIYVARFNTPSIRLAGDPKYRALIRRLAGRRLQSLALPFGQASREERALFDGCLADSKTVSARVRWSVLSLLVFGLLAVAASYWGVRSAFGGEASEPTVQTVLDSRGACEGGDGRACDQLALAYCHGERVPLDPALGAELYRRACAAGRSESCGRTCSGRLDVPSRVASSETSTDLPPIAPIQRSSSTLAPPRPSSSTLAPPRPTARPSLPVREREVRVENLHPISMRASSFINNPDHPFSASLAFDGDQRTAWNESGPGPGRGEWIEADFGEPVRIRRLTITTGWDFPSPRHGDLFPLNSHLRRARVTFDGGSARDESVGDDQRTLVINVDVVARVVRLRAIDVYPGTRWSDLCISEFSIEGAPSDR